MTSWYILANGILIWFAVAYELTTKVLSSLRSYNLFKKFLRMVKITFKPTNDEIFEIDFDPAQHKTVGDMKNVVAERVKETTDKIKFIFKGKLKLI